MERFFHSELDELRLNLLHMADLAASSVNAALQALYDGDVEAARQVRTDDDALDQLEIEIDAAANRYISLRAPVARDVRVVTVALKASHELERIGDEGTSIAKRVIHMAGKHGHLDLSGIQRIAAPAMALIRESIDCMVTGDITRAGEIPRKDKAIDAIHAQNYEDSIRCIGEDPENAAGYIDLIFVSKSIERIADHATNIAVEVIYLVEGEDIRHTDRTKRSKL